MNMAKQAKSNPKTIWKYINSKSKTRDTVADLHADPKNTNSPLKSTNKDKAEVLSDFFCSVFTNESPGELPEIPQYPIKEKMEELCITENMVKKLLSKLNVNKSPGIDSMHPKFLQELASEIAGPICEIFKTSIRSGKLPQEWKNARISAIFKKGNRKIASNYRPVSLTSIICKTMEKIIRSHIIDHMQRNQLFSDKQFGFISGRSTALQLLKVLDIWTEAIDCGFSVDVIYMDFMKAFDTVPHRRLVAKLSGFKINGNIIKWIEQFLSNRHQQVMVNGEVSSWRSVTSGIPQGSVLGPILFVLYINDLPDNVNSTAFLFADDTKLFRIIKDISDKAVLQSDLHLLIEWSNRWLLRFHPDKCKAMNIATNPSEINAYTLTINNTATVLENITQKDIGVTIDNRLEFDSHINAKINKANSMFSLIRRSYKFLNKDMFIPLYKALVRSHLDYANSVWYPYKQKYVDAIEGVQRRATKQIAGLKNLSYEERLKVLKLPTIAYRRIRGDMIEVYKILHQIYDKEVCNILHMRRDHINRMENRGHSLMLFHKFAAKNIRKNNFTNRVVSTWNKLTDEVVTAPSLNCFKNRLDKHWINQELLYNYKMPITGPDRKYTEVKEDLTIEAT